MKKLLDCGEYRIESEKRTLSSATGVRYLYFSTNEYDNNFRKDYISDGENLFLLSENRPIYNNPIALLKSNQYIYATLKKEYNFSIYTWSPVNGIVELADDMEKAVICLEPESVFILHTDGNITINDNKNLPIITGSSRFIASANGAYVLAKKADQMVICDVKGMQHIVNVASDSHSLPIFISDDGNTLIWTNPNEFMYYIHDIRQNHTGKLTFKPWERITLYVTRDGKKIILQQTNTHGQKKVINTFYDTETGLHRIMNTQEEFFFTSQLTKQIEEYTSSYFENFDNILFVCNNFINPQSEFYFLKQIPDEHNEFFFESIYYRNRYGFDIEIATGGGEDGCTPELYRFVHNNKECLAVCGDWGGLKVCYEEDGFCQVIKLDNIPNYVWGSCCYDDGKLVVFQKKNNEYNLHGIIQGEVWFFAPLNTTDSGRKILTTKMKDTYRLHLKNNILLVISDAYAIKKEDDFLGWCVSISVFHLKTGKTQILENVRYHFKQETDGSFYYLVATSKPEYCDLWYYSSTKEPHFLAHNVSEDIINQF